MIINENLHLVEGVSYLKQLRDALGDSREKFAAKIGTSANTIYRWETGMHTVSFTGLQWKNFYSNVMVPLKIEVLDIPDDLGAPYVPKAG